MTDQRLRAFLEECFHTYHRPEYLSTDPLICLKRFTRPRDLEIAGLVAAMLAYGRVETIIRNVNDVFARMDNAPADIAVHTTLGEKLSCLKGFKHRFNSGADLAAVLHAVGHAVRRYGSLEAFFTTGLTPSARTIRRALDRFTLDLKRQAHRIMPSAGTSLDFLLPSPSSGSACKRMTMFLRWMVRPRDGVDLGIWKSVSPALLIMPLDTHVARSARSLGLSSRRSIGWTMAEEVTAALRRIAPFDPVRFDFSLCRNGMTGFRRRAA